VALIINDFGRDPMYSIKQYRWDPIGDIQREVQNVQNQVENIIPGATKYVPGLASQQIFEFAKSGQFNDVFNGWDNPFSNLARELSGQNGGFFNPFNLGAELGDKNAIEYRDKWGNFQKKLNDDVHSNVDNVVGEFGSNKDRQKNWEQKVKDDAQAAQDKYFAEQLGARQQADLAGSRAAGRNRSPGSRMGKNLNFDVNNADMTDYLGL
jgi:hypothetical protein